jgi:hypothetical protein
MSQPAANFRYLRKKTASCAADQMRGTALGSIMPIDMQVYMPEAVTT